MAWVLVPIRGGFDGGEVTAEGLPLDLPWDGCELTQLADLPSLYAAVATAEAKDWLVGVRAPLLAGEAVPDLQWLSGATEAAWQESLQWLEAALRRAHSVGARYLTLPWQPPAGPAPAPEQLAAGLRELVRLQAQAGVQLVLEVSPPGPAAGPPAPFREAAGGGNPGLPLLGWAPAGSMAAADPATGPGTWAGHLRLPLEWLQPAGGEQQGGWIEALLQTWAGHHPYGRLVLDTPAARPAGAAGGAGAARGAGATGAAPAGPDVAAAVRRTRALLGRP